MSNELGKTVLFRMNGVAPGFLREYGCHSCPQCSSSKPQAHISASLLIKDRWGEAKRKLLCHILFDCGIGAIDSLIDFGAPPVDHVFISHGHAYHSLGFDRLVFGQERHGGRIPVPVHCTEPTLKEGPLRIYPWFFNKKNPRRRNKGTRLFFVPAKFLAPVKIPQPDIADIGLRITPVPVYQGPHAGAPVIWVVEFGNQKAKTYRKLVLGWELVHFLPRFRGEDNCRNCGHEERNLRGPNASRSQLAKKFPSLFKNVNELFFDGNTRTPQPSTNHMSIDAGLKFLIPEINPARTWIVHYSGHEDPGGPMSDEELQDWVDLEIQKRGLRDDLGKLRDVRVAKHGMVLAYEV